MSADCDMMKSSELRLASLRIKAYRQWIVRSVMKSELVRFLMAGTVSALANLASAWGYRRLFENTPFHFDASVALGFSLGTMISFLLNKFFTFRVRDGKTWVQFIRFVLVGIVSIAVSTVVAHLLLRALWMVPGIHGNPHLVETIAHILTIGAMTTFNYFVIKYVAFAGFVSRRLAGGTNMVLVWFLSQHLR